MGNDKITVPPLVFRKHHIILIVVFSGACIEPSIGREISKWSAKKKQTAGMNYLRTIIYPDSRSRTERFVKFQNGGEKPWESKVIPSLEYK